MSRHVISQNSLSSGQPHSQIPNVVTEKVQIFQIPDEIAPKQQNGHHSDVISTKLCKKILIPKHYFQLTHEYPQKHTPDSAKTHTDSPPPKSP